MRVRIIFTSGREVTHKCDLRFRDHGIYIMHNLDVIAFYPYSNIEQVHYDNAH